jgi:FlaA1/EpsC-like NDP-sugar epimerase
VIARSVTRIDPSSRPRLPDRIVAHLRRDIPLALLDLAAVFVAYLVPLVVRFGGAVPDVYWRAFWAFGATACLLHLLANYLFGLYGQMWRFASVLEARRVILAALLAGAVMIGADLAPTGGQRPLPLSVVVLGATLSLMAFGTIRFQARLFGFRRRAMQTDLTRVLVVGAGEAGALLLQDLLENPRLGLDPVGVVDDDPRKFGLTLRGVRVLGSRGAIPVLIQRLQVDQVLLAIPSATSELVRDVAALCEESDVSLRVLPSRHELVGGTVTARDIRDLRIEDVLGRQQVVTDLETVGAMLRGRRVLVTGAGGSIGSEIGRQVAAFGPADLILLDHDETHLHDLLVDVGNGGARPLLADIRDRERIVALFARERPEIVFHAAAHKHVPILETHPEEAVFTNVLGTVNVADAAVLAGVKRFVLISTDKAIRPVGVMGASKWFAEQIVATLSGGSCVFAAVRFGNVLGSRGSVIPTFLRQIARGGPVTVTDPEMSRYFMSVEEAVQLVLHASAIAVGGETFTLDMGESIKIVDLARRLIRLSGRVPGRDVPIEIVGRRPGEKLTEELTGADEEQLPSVHPGIRVARPGRPAPAELRASMRELELLALAENREALRVRITELPERLGATRVEAVVP